MGSNRKITKIAIAILKIEHSYTVPKINSHFGGINNIFADFRYTDRNLYRYIIVYKSIEKVDQNWH